MNVPGSKEGIDFGFFDDEDESEEKKFESSSRNGLAHLSKESLRKHDRIHSNNNNTRPSCYVDTNLEIQGKYSDSESDNGSGRPTKGESVKGRTRAANSNGESASNTGSDTETETDSSSDDEKTSRRSRTISSRSTNISVKVPTANNINNNTESDTGDKHKVKSRDSDNNHINNIGSKGMEQSYSQNAESIVSQVSSKNSRPQTAKVRKHKESWTSEDFSDKNDSDASKSSYSSSSESDSDSDGSVTDVSPIHSPDRSKKYSNTNSEGNFRKDEKEMNRRSDGVRFVEVTPGYSIHGSASRPQDTESKELSMLLKAVLEMDDCPTKTELDSLQKEMSRPSSGRSGRGGKRPQSTHLPHHRMNMSFSNDEVRRIDRDNQRLLNKIVNNKPHVPTVRGSKPSSQQKSHSAIRRMKEQKRIESENMQILRRIEAAKATPAVRKENLTKNYQKQVQYSNQVGKSPHRPSSGRRTGSTYVNKMAKASSMTSLNSDLSRMSGATGSRPSSGRYSMVSDVKPPPRARPAWDEHWHAG